MEANLLQISIFCLLHIGRDWMEIVSFIHYFHLIPLLVIISSPKQRDYLSFHSLHFHSTDLWFIPFDSIAKSLPNTTYYLMKKLWGILHYGPTYIKKRFYAVFHLIRRLLFHSHIWSFSASWWLTFSCRDLGRVPLAGRNI